MGSSNAIARFDVLPDYGRGFVFDWRMRGGFDDARPWRAVVERGLSQEGPWKPVSPELDAVTAYRMDRPPLVNKSDSLFFRLVVDTPDGHYESHVVSPYGDLSRSEFLLGADIMRREVLHMSKKAGVACSVWTRVDYGPRCARCVDPITGHSRDNHCPLCLGTGRFPPYCGPFRIWGSFSEDSNHVVSEGHEGTGMFEDRKFSVRAVSSVPISKNDIVMDTRTGKMHYVNIVKIVAELRRVPLVQSLDVSEIAVSDPAYMLTGVGHVA